MSDADNLASCRQRLSYRRHIVHRILKNVLVTLSIAAFAATACGCKRTDNGNDALSVGSSGVMSNSAGMSGTAGGSDAANRAGNAATASGSQAASGEAPVVSTPASAASQ
jgi:hypothetical protein